VRTDRPARCPGGILVPARRHQRLDALVLGGPHSPGAFGEGVEDELQGLGRLPGSTARRTTTRRTTSRTTVVDPADVEPGHGQVGSRVPVPGPSADGQQDFPQVAAGGLEQPFTGRLPGRRLAEEDVLEVAQRVDGQVEGFVRSDDEVLQPGEHRLEPFAPVVDLALGHVLHGGHGSRQARSAP
jgi:hypothetical protein